MSETCRPQAAGTPAGTLSARELRRPLVQERLNPFAGVLGPGGPREQLGFGT